MNVGSELFTPGRGYQAARKSPFKILLRDPNKIIIRSGKSKISLEKDCFDVVENAFSQNPVLWLRVASLRENEPFENSVDKLIREATGSQLARGNYICAMLECCGLVRYSMQRNKKGIELLR
jgi:hypothetical protein